MFAHKFELLLHKHKLPRFSLHVFSAIHHGQTIQTDQFRIIVKNCCNFDKEGVY